MSVAGGSQTVVKRFCSSRIRQIKLLKQAYRLVYGLQDDVLLVMVMAVDKREDSIVYQSAMQRLSDLITELAKAAPQL